MSLDPVLLMSKNTESHRCNDSFKDTIMGDAYMIETIQPKTLLKVSNQARMCN